MMIFISEFKDFLLVNHLAKITIFSYPFSRMLFAWKVSAWWA